jgi:hypothetical protein
MNSMRRFLLPLVLAGSAFLATGCSAPDKGALILAISTDMQAPKDINVVSLYVETDGVVKFDYMGRVLPDGTVSIPSTLALVEPDNLNAQVRIRITAFQVQSDGSAKARVMRDVLTTVPHERTALMRLPLNFLDDGSAMGTLPAQYVPDAKTGVAEGDTTYGPADPTGPVMPKCDYSQGLTSIAGACVNATVDSTTAPDYADDLVYGQGGTADNVACFDVTRCFANHGTPMQAQNVTMNADGSCSIPATPGQNWNCAIDTSDGTGNCIGPNGTPPCLVPLESDPGEGFSVDSKSQTVVMVPGVCSRIKGGAHLYIDKTSCTTKAESAPVCQPMPTSNAVADAASHPPPADGGTTVTDSGTFGDASASDASSGGVPDGGGSHDGGGFSDSGTGGNDATVDAPSDGGTAMDASAGGG